MHASWAARTDPGFRRSQNEDCYVARPEMGLFAVADGMGGHAGGEIASKIAVEAIAEAVEVTATLSAQDAWPLPFDASVSRDANRLRAGFDLANRKIRERVIMMPALRGMGTTAVAVLVGDETTTLAHVGDSRAYLYRSADLTRLTRDHSWVEEQVQTGALSETAAREHPWRNIVTRALSGDGVIEVELTELDLRLGDRVILCSDGLSSVLCDVEISEIVSRHADLQTMCDDLVRVTNANGGPDNVTTVVLDINAG